MNFETFQKSLAAQEAPNGIRQPLQALWHEAKGDWRRAHRLVQTDHTRAAAWVHAYLHRKEGDASNAAYWYAEAGKPGSESSFEAEWSEIATALLQENDP